MINLDELAQKHGTDKSSLIHGYCEWYEFFLNGLRHRPIRLLEVGVSAGASIRAWLEYFPKAQICGVDIGEPPTIADDRFKFIKGDQGSADFWKDFDPFKAPWDIIIDDGSHAPSHVIATFRGLWPKLKPNGIYVIEDAFVFFNADYKKHFEGTIGPQPDMTQWLGGMIRKVNLSGKYFSGYAPSGPPEELTEFEKTVESMTFIKGLVVMTKREGPPNLL